MGVGPYDDDQHLHIPGQGGRHARTDDTQHREAKLSIYKQVVKDQID